jgi:hypothetical protein
MPKVALDRKPALAGQQPVEAAEPALRRLVLAVDSSGPMRGEAKIEVAERAASEFLSGVPREVEVGLVAFGHRGGSKQDGKAESCAGVGTVYELGPASREAVRSAIASFEAGYSSAPAGNPGEQVVYVVSDGLETCGGDPVAAARRLRESDVRAVVDIVGFDIEAKDRAQLQSVAAPRPPASRPPTRWPAPGCASRTCWPPRGSACRTRPRRTAGRAGSTRHRATGVRAPPRAARPHRRRAGRLHGRAGVGPGR